ncbi:universal stress protein [Mycobacterium szulgai]|uniref:universal stress protein n=1 Tax=Mycobacterium szulgai TaxID=1787 RepID=UPI0021F2EA80|nr:universal stress protein [Mycobacterium szulgai]MCV7075489.1 universal stress protein [Mycobacterium szulgai]
MSDLESPRSIVVGIDGSTAAINAAMWAAPEAHSRDIPLHLIHAIAEQQADAPPGEINLDRQYGETALRTASAAVHAMGQPVKIETDLVLGSPADVLIDESSHAAMVCVGSVGIGVLARKLLGSTADAVARHSLCPAAIIRTDHESTTVKDSDWIAIVVDDAPDNDAVVEHGFRQARLRNAPILALGVWPWGFGEIPYEQLNHRLGQWVSRYPEVHVQPAAARRGAAAFLTSTQEPVQLAVLGSAEADHVSRIVGPVSTHFGHSGCSVLVVRE